MLLKTQSKLKFLSSFVHTQPTVHCLPDCLRVLFFFFFCRIYHARQMEPVGGLPSSCCRHKSAALRSVMEQSEALRSLSTTHNQLKRFALCLSSLITAFIYQTDVIKVCVCLCVCLCVVSVYASVCASCPWLGKSKCFN